MSPASIPGEQRTPEGEQLVHGFAHRRPAAQDIAEVDKPVPGRETVGNIGMKSGEAFDLAMDRSDRPNPSRPADICENLGIWHQDTMKA
jgi:hypothetical protein